MGHIRHDPYAHLREHLRTYRFAMADDDVIAWCVGCEQHHAPTRGALCPICASEAPTAA